MKNEQIIEKAQELGKMIAESEAKQRAQAASAALLADGDASQLINEYNEKREAKTAQFADKQPTQEEVQEINEYLQGEFNKIAENAIIREYIEASRDYEMMLSQMDSIIQHYVAGDEGGCGGSCSSCAGCH